jgi:hypothetical protein
MTRKTRSNVCSQPTELSIKAQRNATTVTLQN